MRSTSFTSCFSDRDGTELFFTSKRKGSKPLFFFRCNEYCFASSFGGSLIDIAVMSVYPNGQTKERLRITESFFHFVPAKVGGPSGKLFKLRSSFVNPLLNLIYFLQTNRYKMRYLFNSFWRSS